MNKKIKIFLSAVLIFCGLSIAGKAWAVTLYFDSRSNEVRVGDTFIVELKIDSQDKEINAADGRIFFDKEIISVKELSAGGSLFNMWMKEPVYLAEKGEIVFTGGVIGGYKGGEADIFKMIFEAKKEGKTAIEFRDGVSVFLNDGQGTQENPWIREFEILVMSAPKNAIPADEWKELTKEDAVAPEPFEITLGADSSLFGGKAFIAFSTTDKDSGIDRYEVKEGIGFWHIVQSPYALKDQDLRSIIKVAAVDKAGNRAEAVLLPKNEPLPLWQYYILWIGAGGFIILASFVYLLYKVIRRK